MYVFVCVQTLTAPFHVKHAVSLIKASVFNILNMRFIHVDTSFVVRPLLYFNLIKFNKYYQVCWAHEDKKEIQERFWSSLEKLDRRVSEIRILNLKSDKYYLTLLPRPSLLCGVCIKHPSRGLQQRLKNLTLCFPLQFYSPYLPPCGAVEWTQVITLGLVVIQCIIMTKA